MVAVALLCVVVAGSCVRQLPPAPTPEPRAPAVDTTAPLAPGYGRLVIDVVEGPTAVQRVHMQAQQVDSSLGRSGFWFVETPELLCPTSPCVADLPIGNVLLGFPVLGDSGSSEVELVYVDSEPTVYRRSLSIYENHGGAGRVLGIVAASLGGMSMTTGAALLPIGLAKDKDGLTLAGATTLGAGAIVLTFGILGIVRYAPTYRTGAALHFSPQSPN